jgi:hypothetical protein
MSRPCPDRHTAFGALALAVLIACAFPSGLLPGLSAPAEAAPAKAGHAGAADRQHIVYFQGTDQELEIYKIYGRHEGPTIMILGGIQGDEPGGFMSADLYVDTALERGNLIVVPRANFKSIIAFDRGTVGDMNRKFTEARAGSKPAPDPDLEAVRVIKNLMAEADLFLNLHDGSGFYRHSWESEMANPGRYGQCIIADAEEYTVPATGRLIALGRDARRAVEMVNRAIPEDAYKFRFSNHDTLADDTRHAEQRASATFYALTVLGIPAFGIETSKQLPSLEMKIRQHNLAVNAFMEIFGVVPESPRVRLEPPELNFIVVSVEGHPLMAVRDGETLLVPKGAAVAVLHVAANYTRGLSADVMGLGGLNDMDTPLRVSSPTSVVVRRDNVQIGLVELGLLPPGSSVPRTVIPVRTEAPPAIVAAGGGLLPGQIPDEARPESPIATAALGGGIAGSAAAGGDTPRASEAAGAAAPPAADAEATAPGSGASVPTAGGSGASVPTAGGSGASVPVASGVLAGGAAGTQGTGRPQVSGPLSPPDGAGAVGAVTSFILEVDGRPVSLAPEETLSVRAGAKIRMVDISSPRPLPEGTVMNFKGFVGRQGDTTGNDKGTVCDTARDLLSYFALKGQGEFPVYQLGAENGKEILARAYVRITALRLDSAVFEKDGVEKTLKLAQRWHVPAGARLTLKEVRLAGGAPLEDLRITLGGRPVPADLPQEIVMPQIAVSLAVFSKGELAGKVVLFP